MVECLGMGDRQWTPPRTTTLTRRVTDALRGALLTALAAVICGVLYVVIALVYGFKKPPGTNAQGLHSPTHPPPSNSSR